MMNFVMQQIQGSEPEEKNSEYDSLPLENTDHTNLTVTLAIFSLHEVSAVTPPSSISWEIDR